MSHQIPWPTVHHPSDHPVKSLLKISGSGLQCPPGQGRVAERDLHRFSKGRRQEAAHSGGPDHRNALPRSAGTGVRDGRCWQAGIPLRTVRENLLHVFLLASGGFLVAFESLGLQKHPFIPAFTVTWCSPCVGICVQISPFHEDASHVGLGSPFQ